MKLQELPMKHVCTSVINEALSEAKKMKLNFPTMSCSFKTDPDRCVFTHRAVVYRQWFKVTVVHRNIYVAEIAINSI